MIDTNPDYTTLQNKLNEIARGYLLKGLDVNQLSNTTAAYKSLLNKLYDENLDVEAGRTDVDFANGKAIGTFWAASCLEDHLRTRSFIRGIDNAIRDKLKDQISLNILYAGTGPYATLLLPLMSKYAEYKVKYTFIEINSLSLQILKQVISKVGFQDFDITFLQEDASRYQIDGNNQPDIIISETMQKALEKEQQVPIFLNLMDQVGEDTLFIPEKIELVAGLADEGFDFINQQPESFQNAGTLFEMSKTALLPKSRWVNEQSGETIFQQTTLKIDKEALANARHLFLLTEIRIYGSERLLVGESGLTIPTYMASINEGQSGDMFIECRYQVSEVPGLDYNVRFSGER